MPVAIITGASRGIGAAVAARLAHEGYELFLVARNADRLEQFAESLISAHGRKVETFAADLRGSQSPTEICDAFGLQYERLDVLVNNAGLAPAGPAGEYDRQLWEDVFSVNCHAPFFLTQRLLPLLRAASPGYLINVASVVARTGYPHQALYGASKHALLGWTKAIAREIPSSELRVHALLPGGVNTDMIRAVRPDIESDQLISPDDIAETVMFLLRMRGNAMIDQVEIRRTSKPGFP